VYQQRDERTATELAGLWQPRFLRVDDGEIEFVPSPDDAYVVVDEMIGEQVRLAVTRWPGVDEGGRLRFEETGSEPVGVERGALQTELDRRRGDEGQLPRPLRIGDVFLVRGFGEDPSRWQRALDITAQARRAASRAGIRAVAQVVEAPSDLLSASEDIGETWESAVPSWRRPPQERPPQGGLRPPAEPSPGSVSNAAV